MGQTFVYNLGKEELKRDELQFTFGVFIDGTLNNKDNTDMHNVHARGAKKSEEDGYTDIDYSKSNKEIEKSDHEEYAKIKNKSRIEDLLANRNKTPEQKAEFDNIPEKHKYLVASHRSYMDKLGTDNSFSNDYTNVARMWNYCEKGSYRIYVEGMGTDKLARDSQDGFAFGAGFTGIRARVRNACEQIAEKIQEKKKNNRIAVVTKITIDVFGFSRGAAAARNFVHEINLKASYSAEEKNIPDGYDMQLSRSGDDVNQEQKYRKATVDADNMEVDTSVLENETFLPTRGHLGYSLLKNKSMTPSKLLDIQVIVRFIGLYDTVSSYYEDGKLGKYDDYGNLKEGGFGKLINEGISTNFNNNVEPMKLNVLGNFQKIVHFTAKNEHRRNFSLTRINQVADRAIEKNFPGVHCDIGGAYESEKENVDEIGTTYKDAGYKSSFLDYQFPLIAPLVHKTGLRALKQDLVKQYWFQEGQLDINWQMGWIPPVTTYRKLTGTRFVKKEYSYLPLHFMEEYAQSTPMEPFIIKSLVKKYPVNDFLEKIKTHLHHYAFGDGKEWEFISDDELEDRKKKREAIAAAEQEEQKRKQELERIRLEVQEELKNPKGMEPVYDNLNPKDYIHEVAVEEAKKVMDLEFEKKDKVIVLEEIVVAADSPQKMLRQLRNEYLHWSSNRDWLGMEPNGDRHRRFMS